MVIAMMIHDWLRRVLRGVTVDAEGTLNKTIGAYNKLLELPCDVIVPSFDPYIHPHLGYRAA